MTAADHPDLPQQACEAVSGGASALRGTFSPGPSPRVQQALLSLQNSRLALRQELIAPARATPRQGRAGAAARLWWRHLRTWPATRMLGEAVQHWWRSHPLHPLGSTLLSEARTQVLPLVRRHPWAILGVAAALGAAAVAARPWRWEWINRQVRQAPGAASNWLVRQLSTAPVQAMVASVVAMLAQKSAPRPAPEQSVTASSDAPDTPDAPPAVSHASSEQVRHVVH